jgi:hypothetical protein
MAAWRHGGGATVWVAGAALTVLAATVSWWWLVFGQLIETALLPLPQAVPCLAIHSDRCSLAEALCTRPHLFAIRNYWPEAFWIGLALTAVALLLPALRSNKL